MAWLQELAGGFDRLFGGNLSVLLILLLAIALWTLIVERYWYFLALQPQAAEETLRRWRRRPLTAGSGRRWRRRLIGIEAGRLRRPVRLIQDLLAVIVLLGLLGAVDGLIGLLKGLASGRADPHALVQGIGGAALPVITALAVTASGVYFSRALQARAETAARLLRDRLRRD